jgi:hypothetical protein
MEILFRGIPLDQVSTSMTINAPAAVIFCMYLAVAEKQGVPFAKLEGTLQNDILKEYIAQKEWIYPPPPEHAHHHGPHGVLFPQCPEVEHDLDLRLSHSRGGLDRGPGAGLHVGGRHRLRRGGAESRAQRRRFRAALVLLLQLAQ